METPKHKTPICLTFRIIPDTKQHPKNNEDINNDNHNLRQLKQT